MKKITLLIIGLVVAALIGVYIYMIQVDEKYYIYLHENIFIETGFSDDNREHILPYQFLLSSFSANDTTAENASYQAVIYAGPRNNIDRDNIEEFILEPYQVIKYNGYRLYINEFTYNPSSNKALVVLTMERRRYQHIR